MNKNIGIVCEGPTDYILLEGIVDQITGTDNYYMKLQPEDNLMGEYGNGWKGVWKWCLDNEENLDRIMKDISPKIDFLIVQMDGDVSRKEKEVHCRCRTTVCEIKDEKKQNPLECKKIRTGECPVELPCTSHPISVEGYMGHLTGLIFSWLGQKEVVCTVIPCDSTDAWVAAAYDNIENIEQIADPWGTIISRGKLYHDIRIHGNKKSVSVYRKFVPKVCQQWESVKQRCVSARLFEENIRKYYLD